MGEASDSRELLPVLGEIPGHLFWRAAARATAALGEVLPTGLDIHAHASLLALAGGVTRSQRGIAEMISVSRTTMTRVATDLADQGFVRRVRNPEDRRSFALTRTAEGAAAARRWRRHAEHVEDAITTDFTAAEREEFRSLLQTLARPELSADTPDPLLESIPFLITRIHAAFHATMLTALEPIGVEPRQFGTLTALRASGPVSQADLARMLGVSHPSVVQIVDDLELRGLLERRRPPTDRRTQELHLTAATAPTVERATEVVSRTEQGLLAALSGQQRAHLLDLLRRLVTTA